MSDTESALAELRERMVADQIFRRGIKDERLLNALREVPRHEFVPPEQKRSAYIDAPLPIGDRQTISQPYIVALMTSLLELRGDETVLEVGTGSGYQAAILSRLAKKVYSVERFERLAEEARGRLLRLGYENVEVVVGDGTAGLPEHAPFEGILVTAAAPRVPPPLENQLAEGGRLVLPVGGRLGQVLEVWRCEQDRMISERVTPVAFVPLIGKHGWPDEEGHAFDWS
ncbi:MAG: protein-L-isoaspartate(D-aspartate) O-methyltransferase [Anaerolineales bacterium]|jgi:protein-L-isoaspartate(D-aspartate) O-methyltransferase